MIRNPISFKLQLPHRDLRDSKEKKKKKTEKKKHHSRKQIQNGIDLDLASVFPGFHWA